ncbi:MAG: 1-acyl-sn-glycerol-3-phosphate acyltransferase [Bacteroidales bacterium]|nr:1-acyl-sn-glycerol-3-phosphate acyltransferase [Bacteroidales bacterium]
MNNIWDEDKLYSFLRRYVDLCARRSFRRVEVVGQLPDLSDGAWLFIANHTHTLMDALVILQLRHEPTAFGARADVFRNPTAAKFLRFCKMVPLGRKGRDSEEEVSRNAGTLMEIDRVLEHGVPFCLFPEGRHRPMHSLMPFHRGVASMGFRSAAKRPTHILPIGLEYSDWFHYRGHVRVTLGEPVDMNAFAASLPEGIDDSARDYELQNELQKRVASLIFYLPDDETYAGRLAYAEGIRKKMPMALCIILGALSFPFFLLSSVLTAPLWACAEIICSGIKDRAWHNTVRFGIRLVGTPLWGLILAVLLFVFLPWWAAALLLLYYLPSYSIFYDWLNLITARLVPPLPPTLARPQVMRARHRA